MNHQPTEFATRAEAFEASEDAPANPSKTRSFGEVVHARYIGRRGLLKGMTAVAALAAATTPMNNTL